MKNILKKTKLNLILASILTVILGLILVLNPVNATVFICRTVGIILLATGLFITGSYFLNIGQNVGGSSLIAGLIELALGIWVSLRPDSFVQFLTVILGFIMLVHSFVMLQSAIEIKMFGIKRWWLLLITALLTLILGIIIIISPFATIAVTMTIAGISLIADGIIGIIVTILISRAEKMIKETMQQTGYIETDGKPED